MEETWKPLVLEGVTYSEYDVSTHGRVRRTAKGMGSTPGRIRTPQAHSGGYLQMVLHLKGERKNVYVHRLVAETFLGAPFEGGEINHVDGNKQNNRAENLEWCYRGENISHAIETGLNVQYGQSHSMAKLCDDDVYQIKRLAMEGTLPRDLGEQFGVTCDQIVNILTGRGWKHLFNPADDFSSVLANPTRGERNSRAKLTEADVRCIRSRIASGETYKEVAPSYGVTVTLIRMIGQHKVWRHVA